MLAPVGTGFLSVGGSLMQRVVPRMLKLSPKESEFDRRGFYLGFPAVRCHLERIGGAFITGYNAMLASRSIGDIETELHLVDPALRGFAFEGASMAASILDRFTSRSMPRWKALLEGPGRSYSYLVYVGAGWAWARLPAWMRPLPESLDPLYGWLAVDGQGFCSGYFSGGGLPALPKHLSGYEFRAFDQGLGRSLWFRCCADVDRVAECIASIPSYRHGDLWSGVGLAATYAGGVEEWGLTRLKDLARPYSAEIAQGAVFAAAARVLGRNVTPETEMATHVLAGLSPESAARLSDAALPPGAEARMHDAYEGWRKRIQAHFAHVESPD